MAKKLLQRILKSFLCYVFSRELGQHFKNRAHRVSFRATCVRSCKIGRFDLHEWLLG